ncbi:hypothetical protein [Candidatus Palauibacter sp.]|uniref:hypothetical protein n=1 Tax=Candidatus Palauibacter sp. TaxID=3101350 RepID=UPI003AF26F48
MNPRIKAQAGALVAMIVLFYVLYRFVYIPVAGATMPGWVAIVVTCLVATCFLDWVNRSLGDPVRAAVIIAISQVIFTNVYGWLRGDVALVAAIIGSILLIAGWGVVGFVYGKLAGDAGN